MINRIVGLVLIGCALLGITTTPGVTDPAQATLCGSWQVMIDTEKRLAAGTCCLCNYKTIPCHCGHVSGYKSCPCNDGCTTGYRPEDEGFLDGVNITLRGQVVDQQSTDRMPIAGLVVTIHFNGKQIADVTTDGEGGFRVVLERGNDQTTSDKIVDLGSLLAIRDSADNYAITLWRDVVRQPFLMSSKSY
jgi:hypothetical protein